LGIDGRESVRRKIRLDSEFESQASGDCNSRRKYRVDYSDWPSEEFRTSDHPEKSSATWDIRLAHDRRADPRYKFVAAVELVDAQSGVRIKGTLGDLSVRGCFARTTTLFPKGTEVTVYITKGKDSVEAKARVITSQAGKGMGLRLASIEPRQQEVLDRFVAAAMEFSWIASNRRKTQRILMRLAIRVSGYDEAGISFKESTHTISISPAGALILISCPVRMGQRLVLLNNQSKSSIECTVVHKGMRHDGAMEVGVQFSSANPTFWGVRFPPADWSPQHPDSKYRT